MTNVYRANTDKQTQYEEKGSIQKNNRINMPGWMWGLKTSQIQLFSLPVILASVIRLKIGLHIFQIGFGYTVHFFFASIFFIFISRPF